jgi:hypothetical protein
MNRLSEQVHDFNEECISHGRRTRIFDADGITKLSMEGLLKKYYSEWCKNYSKAVFVQYVNKDSTIIDIAATNRIFIISWL